MARSEYFLLNGGNTAVVSSAIDFLILNILLYLLDALDLNADFPSNQEGEKTMFGLIGFFLLLILSSWLFWKSLGVCCSLPWGHLLVKKDVEQKLIQKDGYRRMYYTIALQAIFGMIMTVVSVIELFNPWLGDTLKTHAFCMWELFFYVVYFSYILSAHDIWQRWIKKSGKNL